MTTPLAQLEERIAKLEEAAEDIREATREAHSATKELRRVHKEVRRMIDEEVPEIVGKAIDKAVADGLAEYGGTIKAAMDVAVEKVCNEFNKLADIYTMGAGKENEHIAIAVHETRRARQQALAELKVRDLTR